MWLSLDHVFIIARPGAPEAQQLIDIGLVEGNPNVHPGQGTANRRFFMDAFTIELLYVSDEHEAATGAGKGLGILARSRGAQANPFGLVVRTSSDEQAPAFPSWQYFPDYFDADMCFYVGNNSDQLNEPLCICMPPSLPESSGVATEYANPGWQLTALKIDVPTDQPSQILRHFSAMDKMQIEYGKPHRMILQFNHCVTGRVSDLAPELPLTLQW